MTDARKTPDGLNRANSMDFDNDARLLRRNGAGSLPSRPQARDHQHMGRNVPLKNDEGDLATSFRWQRDSEIETVADRSVAMPSERASTPETSHLFLDRSPQAPDAASHSRVKPFHSNDTKTTRSNGSRHDFQRVAQADLDHGFNRGTPSQSAFERKDFHPGQECQTRRNFYYSHFTWLNGIIILICILSTALSGLFAVIALKGQRYSEYIGSGPKAKMSPATAILWTSVVAKTIELSFITGFVAFLVQVFSRRAFMKGSGRGVTLSELIMWRWVVQPGTLITSWETTKYAGLSFLGVLTLISTVLSTLYAPAATAIVQPIPKESEWYNKYMAGSVKTTFANLKYLTSLCGTPIRNDNDFGGATCLQIEHAGRSYYNLVRYLADWEEKARINGVSTDQQNRPALISIPYGNSTVVPQWTNIINTSEASNKYQRVINNVSLAMPHIGVYDAAHNRRNSIPQPEESGILGAYSIWASVPSPVLNVLCVSMNETELAPIIYDTWNDEVVNGSTWPTLWRNATTTNNTVVDDIFGWAKKDERLMLDYPPVFARYPKPFNTIMNHTNAYWGRPAMYMLGQGGLTDDGTNLTGHFQVCKFQVDISVQCSTLYSVAATGRKIEALCGDRADDMAYIKTQTNATAVDVPDWRDIGFDWANSLSLNTGIMDADSSNPRTLMMLQLAVNDSHANDLGVKLSQVLPSLSETLAVSGSYSLLSSWQDAPFVEYWNYTTPMLEEPATQYFKAKIKTQEYASGGVDNASKGWIVILFLTFLLNIFVLLYFLLHSGLVTDFSQPANLFALTLNSPPSKVLAGSCGGGPEGEQYAVGWFIQHEGAHLYLEPDKKSAIVPEDATTHGYVETHDPDHIASPRTATPGFWAGSGYPATILANFKGMKPSLAPRAKPTRKDSLATGTEQLQSSNTSESTQSLRAEYELQRVETQTQGQYSRLP